MEIEPGCRQLCVGSRGIPRAARCGPGAPRRRDRRARAERRPPLRERRGGASDRLRVGRGAARGDARGGASRGSTSCTPTGRRCSARSCPGHRALAGEEPAPTLVRYRPAGGGPDRVSQVSAVPVRDTQGELLYVIIHFRDVTDEPVFAAEAAGSLENASLYREAKRTSALLDSLYNSAPIGLGFWDRDLRYVRVNNALAEINERPPEDHPGRTFAEVVPHLAPALESIARRVLETGEPVTALEMVAGTPSDPTAQRFWLTSYYPVLDRDGEALGVGAVIEEVTDRRRAEQRTELQHAVTRILSAADAVDLAVSRVLETVCEALGWDVGCYWPLDPEEPRLTWARAGVRADGFLEMTRADAALAGAPPRARGRVGSSRVARGPRAPDLPARVGRGGRGPRVRRRVPDPDRGTRWAACSRSSRRLAARAMPRSSRPWSRSAASSGSSCAGSAPRTSACSCCSASGRRGRRPRAPRRRCASSRASPRWPSTASASTSCSTRCSHGSRRCSTPTPRRSCCSARTTSWASGRRSGSRARSSTRARSRSARAWPGVSRRRAPPP